jgi:glycosyltransferase involved in cell wall biosynthesis
MMLQFAAEHRRGPFHATHSIWSSHGALVALMARALLGVPMLLHFGAGELSAMPDIEYGNLRTWRGRLFFRLCASGANTIAAQSAPMVAKAAAMNVSAVRLPFGVALDQWPPATCRRRDPAVPARLLHVGSLNAVKDHATLLAAAVILKSSGIAFKLDLIGANAFCDGRVMDLIDRLDLAAQVQWHGELPRPALRQLFDRADMLLVTSRHEAGPIVALEAAIAGVAVLGTDVGHLSEWNSVGGRTVGLGDSHALASRIMEVLENEDQRRALVEEAQHKAVAENADQTAAAVRAIYARLAGEAVS